MKRRRSPKKAAQTEEEKDTIGEFEYPMPMEPLYVNRTLLKPWRRKEENVAIKGNDISTSVMWTHMEQNMFELQVSAAASGTHEPKEFPENPYPQ